MTIIAREGFFITFEGVEGCGKTTQAKLLTDFLSWQGHDVLLTKEPGGTEVGQHIRQILLGSSQPLEVETELFLFCADRAQHVREVLLPALHEGKIIVCERYADSTVAYQHFGLGVPIDFIEILNRWATQGLAPALTILLDVDPKVGFARKSGAAGTKDRIEKRPLKFHQKVREGYLSIAQHEPQRVKVVDGSLPPEEVHRRVAALAEAALRQRE